MKKTVIVLDHNGGRLGNQLWNFIHIYAYCLERGYRCKNYCFFEYENFFDTPLINPFADILSKIIPKRIKRRLHHFLAQKIQSNPASTVLRADKMQGDQAVRFYLPPTTSDSTDQSNDLQLAERSSGSNIYLVGWAFRNPIGIAKYHKEIVTHIRPTRSIQKKVQQNMNTLRQKYSHIVGVHIRQGDYKTYMGGKFFFDQKEIRKILDDYTHNLSTKEAAPLFYICSDGEIEDTAFDGLQHIRGAGTAVEDLFTLSLTDRIIASDSTFSGLAAWYGNIPITLFTRETLDWKKLSEQKQFNYNYGSYNLQP